MDVLIPSTTPAGTAGTSITASRLTTVHADGTTALRDVSLVVEPGRLTAIIGPSGAGKTTLLGTLAGLVPSDRGTVSLHDGAGRAAPSRVGYVPQDDILHLELGLRTTLRHAAALRMPSASRPTIDAAVETALEVLGLDRHADVPVGALSGGQRKRASIACEIVSRPGVCFLDEPTSGLDPAAAAGLVARLRQLCSEGATVVLTTHSVQDVEQCDQVIALATGGRMAFAGPPSEMPARFGVGTVTEVYEHLAVVDPHPAPPVESPPARRPRPAPPARPWRQLPVLTRRAAETIVHNRLTLAILVGSPAAVTAMFAVLFRPDALDPRGADPGAAVMVAYWLAFAGFFFGLTFGLLQVCVEVPILRRERHAGVGAGAYLLSKLALLAPFLLVVNATMLVVLRFLDRLPQLEAGAWIALFTTMALNSVAALCLGLLASASVASTAQAALALPMLCFPAVLFSGAMVPVPVMARSGQVIAAAMPNRWAFEAIAGHLDVAQIAGPAAPHGSLGSSGSAVYWALLAGFAVVFAAAALAAIRQRAASRG